MTTNRFLGPALAAMALATVAADLGAQSALTASGLGYPVEASDARSRALGGVAVGLPDVRMSFTNPASAAGLPAAGLTVTYLSDGFESDAVAEEGAVTTARFPAIQVALPVGARLVLQAGYGAFLERNWSAVRTDTLFLSGQDRQILDRFVATGGASRLRLGAAYALTERLAVGAGADLYTGSARDSTIRAIEGLSGFFIGTDFTYEGVGAVAGARWRPVDALLVGAAVSGGGDLRVETEARGALGKSYPLPLQLNAGASARVSQATVLAASARWAGWSSVDEALEAGGARDVIDAGVGVEYEGLSLIRRPVPLRLGARWTQLPFRWDDDAEFPEERALTGGIGVRLAGGAASIDLAAERGWRGGDAAGLEEDFWRVSASMTLLGR